MFRDPDTLYDRGYRCQYQHRALQGARRYYERLLMDHPDHPRAPHARVQLYNLTVAEAATSNPELVTRSPSYNDYEFGNWLKREAKPNGCYITLRLPNVYSTLQALSRFFLYKKHEWIVFCFFNSDLVCQFVWVNKGPDRNVVAPTIPVDNMLRGAAARGITHVIRAHNHPVSGLGHGYAATRREAIDFFYEAKWATFGFSDQDLFSKAYCDRECANLGMEFTDAVFAAGSYKFLGSAGVLINHEANKPYEPRMDPATKLGIWIAIVACIIIASIMYGG